MAILLIITLLLLVCLAYVNVSLQQRIDMLEDDIHALHHDIDIKIDNIKNQLENGEKN